MNPAHTPTPGALPDARSEGERDPATKIEIEANPQPEPDSSLPREDDPEVEETEQQPS